MFRRIDANMDGVVDWSAAPPGTAPRHRPPAPPPGSPFLPAAPSAPPLLLLSGSLPS